MGSKAPHFLPFCRVNIGVFSLFLKGPLPINLTRRIQTIPMILQPDPR